MINSEAPIIGSVGMEHLRALLELYTFLHPGDEELSDRKRTKNILREMRDDPRTILLGLFIGEHLISACNAALILNLTRGGKPFAIIENVITRPESRGKGYGTLLMKKMIDECWNHGCYKIILQSNSRRIDAHRFYCSIGFDMEAKKAFVMYRR
jgi:GNAT superfamily N-acetyltransferase